MSERLTQRQLASIRERVEKAKYCGEGVGNLVFEDIPKLLAEIERLQKGITAAARETSCDDTWDFLNRLLDGREVVNLAYRIGGDIDE